jgi:hypothetical protein
MPRQARQVDKRANNYGVSMTPETITQLEEMAAAILRQTRVNPSRSELIRRAIATEYANFKLKEAHGE